MSEQENEHTLDVAHGDPGLSRHLKNSLKLLQNKSDDPEFRKLADDVVSGKKRLRDMVDSPAFSRTLDPLVQQASTKYGTMSDEEREELARTGDEQLTRLGDSDESRSPNRRPSQPSQDDDEDFSNTTWLR